MKTNNNDNYDVMKELRKIRRKIYNEIKNLSIEEQMEYFHKGAERFDERMAKYRKEKKQ
ncbi:MAG: hypothetical protein LBU34_13910 [Planctomycetaceae bacterium]|jgi:hypothetical protein|nr:hypothetical protein [Planctomycetaceae bacterium]